MPGKELLDLKQHYQTGDELAAGEWVKLDGINMEVHVARAESPKFFEALALMQRRYGLNKRRGKQDPKKALACTVATMARSIFLGFRGPKGERTVKIGDEEIEDNIAGRERLLMEFPILRRDISDASESLAEEFTDEAEGMGKD
jgi:hypothetical protein